MDQITYKIEQFEGPLDLLLTLVQKNKMKIEDIQISINGKDARTFSSQGQQRSIVLSLKMAEGEVSRELCSEYPVFLFDDVLSELDERRQKFVLEGMRDRQIIITSCERLRTAGKVIEVKGGSFF